MERLGKVQDWNDERGFGFIAPLELTADGGRTFFHIRDYQQAGRRPEAGELVRYQATREADGRWRATRVRRAVVRPAYARNQKQTADGRDPSKDPGSISLLLLPAYGVFLGWAIHTARLPLELAFVVALLCTLTFMAYAADKHAAQKHNRRIPEANLHLLELIGGWPGALLAQRTLRHKSRKRRYRIGFWIMVALNLLATLAWMQWRT